MSTLLLALLAAAPLSIGPTFEGFEQTFSLKTDSDLGQKGMNDCGFAQTTAAPVLTFTVAGVQDAVLELAKTTAGGVLVRGKQHLCLQPGLTTLDPGSYELYLLDGREHPFQTSATVRLFSRAVQARKLGLGLKKVPLSGAGPNPVQVGTSGKTAAVEASVARVSCARGPVQPVAELVVTQASRFSLVLEGAERELYLVSRTGCVVASEDVDLEPGPHALWMEPLEEDAVVLVTDTERGMAVAGGKGDGALPTVKPSGLPKVVRVRAQASRRRGAYDEVSFSGRQPALVIEAATELDEVSVRVVAGLSDVTLDATGDLGTQSGASLRLETKKKWFVYLNSESAGEVVIALTNRRQEEPRAFWSPGAPSPSLAPPDRVVGYHFPFWHLPDYPRPQVLPLFATAPAELFVFLSKEVQEVPTSEPLLVLSHDGKTATVVRLTGEELQVRAALLTTQVPAGLSVPKVKPPRPATSVDDAWADAGPLELARVEAWQKRQKQWTDCVGAYMKKHDPAWGKSYELVYVRSGLNVSDVVYGSARKACNETKFKADGQAFIKAINQSHLKLAASVDGLLRSRLVR